MTKKRIPITVDKSHLITIGEKLYTEKTSFIRELVNNAFDADATEVRVDILPDRIVIADNGSGMDEAGLRLYFTIGASQKRTKETSHRFSRTRIGEYGIGKFSALAVSARFEIETQCDQFHARLIFDKEAWSRHEDWHLDIEELPIDAARGAGTIIILHAPTIALQPGSVRRYLSERTPIHAPNFSVFVNSEKVTDDIVTGQQILINIMTPFGPLLGTLIIVPADKKVSRLGIAVSVKHVLIRYESFGLETSRRWGVTRITGRINVDFLPITSGRDDFLRDSREFQYVVAVMKKQVEKALLTIRQEGDRRANLQASRVLKDAMERIGKAMRRRQEHFPGVEVPFGTEEGNADASSVSSFDVSKAEFVESQSDLAPPITQRLKGQKKPRRGRPFTILGDKSVIRHLRVAHLDIAVRMEHLGEKEDESVLSGGIIFLNLDHPLYRTYANNDDLLTLHVSRIITKELALTSGITNATDAFALQAELLTDAFRGKR